MEVVSDVVRLAQARGSALVVTAEAASAACLMPRVGGVVHATSAAGVDRSRAITAGERVKPERSSDATPNPRTFGLERSASAEFSPCSGWSGLIAEAINPSSLSPLTRKLRGGHDQATDERDVT